MLPFQLRIAELNAHIALAQATQCWLGDDAIHDMILIWMKGR